MRSWDDALNQAEALLERIDAFAARRARRDGDDPLSAPQTRQYEAPPDFREDEHLNPERSELRNGALSKQE
jgi:hypothetical protein